MSQAPALPDWGAPRAAGRPGRGRGPRAVGLAGAGVLVVAGGYLLAGTTGAAVAGVALALLAGVAALWVSAQGRLAVRAAGGRPVSPGEAPRLENLVRGVATDLGMAPPAVWIAPEGGPNALVCKNRAAALLAVRRSAVDELTLTELEAVVAHCLVRVRLGDLGMTAVAAAVGAPGLGPRVGGADDAGAAAVTRYPPALASAIAKAAPVSGRWAPFWFVAEGPSHVPSTERIAALEDL